MRHRINVAAPLLGVGRVKQAITFEGRVCSSEPGQPWPGLDAARGGFGPVSEVFS
jgi:hypothetical protein